MKQILVLLISCLVLTSCGLTSRVLEVDKPKLSIEKNSPLDLNYEPIQFVHDPVSKTYRISEEDAVLLLELFDDLQFYMFTERTVLESYIEFYEF